MKHLDCSIAQDKNDTKVREDVPPDEQQEVIERTQCAERAKGW